MIASLQVASFGPLQLPNGVLGGLVRRPRERTPGGPQFARLFATGDFWTVPAPLPRPQRWALFAIWDGDRAFDRFVASSPFTDCWRSRSRELFTVRLAALRSNGLWAGANPLPPPYADSGPDDPVAVLTYGRLKVRNTARFWRANGRSVAELRRQPGLLAALGLVQPPSSNATFSLWRGAEDVHRFAYAGTTPDHREAMVRMRTEQWHHEYLFARFRAYAWEGLLDGRDPFAAVSAGAPSAVGDRAERTPFARPAPL